MFAYDVTLIKISWNFLENLWQTLEKKSSNFFFSEFLNDQDLFLCSCVLNKETFIVCVTKLYVTSIAAHRAAHSLDSHQ